MLTGLVIVLINTARCIHEKVILYFDFSWLSFLHGYKGNFLSVLSIYSDYLGTKGASARQLFLFTANDNALVTRLQLCSSDSKCYVYLVY